MGCGCQKLIVHPRDVDPPAPPTPAPAPPSQPKAARDKVNEKG